MAFQLATGKDPFLAVPFQRAIAGLPVETVVIPPSMSASLAEVIRGSLAGEPAARPTAARIVELLRVPAERVAAPILDADG